MMAFFEIIKSRAIQGLVVTAGGLALLSLLWLWSKRVSVYVWASSAAIFIMLGSLSILGALQKGPFTFVYKKSVSLRGAYWDSGIEMGLSNPFTGVGMDSYGDWYRRARPPVALIDTPGIAVVTNAAHNVVIDIFAYGGFPLLLSYMGVLFIGLRSIFGVLRKRNVYDPVFAFLAVVWICYQVQSIISINQIGLAVWGWVFTGALFSYARITNAKTESLEYPKPSERSLRAKNSKKAQNSSATVSLATGLGVLLGIIIYLPPLAGDIKWFSARNSRNLENIQAALVPNYFNPANSFKYREAIALLEANNLADLALGYAKKAVKFNPDDFESWRVIYSLPNTTDQLRKRALDNLKRLDPLNPDVTAP
jgi:hypothetical protein